MFIWAGSIMMSIVTHKVEMLRSMNLVLFYRCISFDKKN